MRIISGKYRGKNIFPGKSFKARPTTDFAKESLFNIINNNYDFDELKVLDLFSGTGSISYEFVSRGCENVTAVEINHRHAAFIKRISDEINADIKIVENDVYKFLKFCDTKYDIIFADPPFEMKDIDKLPDLILERNILSDKGWLIIEHSDSNDFSRHPNLDIKKNYGKVNFSFFNPNV